MLPVVSAIAKASTALLLNSQATILFAGDAMQHQAQIDAARQPDGSYSYTECYQPVSDMVSEADFAVVNLETPVGSRPYRGYPCFNAPVSYAAALADAGFDMILTANNHTLDAGADRGLRQTIDALDSLNILHVGTYSDADARKSAIPTIVDIKGFKVGFLNYTYGTNGFQPRSGAVVDYIDRNLIADDIKATRNAGAEILCVAVHWGDEYKLLPNKEQKQLAQWLCDQGVDIIFGGHPHVIQPMEMRYNPVTGKNTALFYSLGNFISNMKTRDTRGGAISTVTLCRDSIGIPYVDSLEYRLVFTVPPSVTHHNFVVYPVNHPAFNSSNQSFNSDSVSISVTPFPADIRAKHDAFVKSATDIFNKHNVGL